MKPRFPSTALTLNVGTGRILTLDTGTFTRGTLKCPRRGWVSPCQGGVGIVAEKTATPPYESPGH